MTDSILVSKFSIYTSLIYVEKDYLTCLLCTIELIKRVEKKR